jgi:hypothetical protein
VYSRSSVKAMMMREGGPMRWSVLGALKVKDREVGGGGGGGGGVLGGERGGGGSGSSIEQCTISERSRLTKHNCILVIFTVSLEHPLNLGFSKVAHVTQSSESTVQSSASS